jgi:hypothetical protein
MLENTVFSEFIVGSALEDSFQELIKVGLFSRSDTGFLD